MNLIKRAVNPLATAARGLLGAFSGGASGGATASYLDQLVTLRSDLISGAAGLPELTATVQTCVSMWEHGLSVADVNGTDILTKRHLALAARSLARRGEAVFLIDDTGLVPCSDWDMSTRNAKPRAYRVSIPEIGGAGARTALADEVLHFRIGSEVSAPYGGTPPLRRAGLTASLLQYTEAALCEVYRDGPIGSQVIPFPESPETDMAEIARAFRQYRGKVQVRESVSVTAAGGPAPQADWQPRSVTPDLAGVMPKEVLEASRNAVLAIYGVLPGMLSPATTGPMVREGQRHLAQWTLQPIAEAIAEEATDKLGTAVEIDVMRPLQAFDAGGRARAVTAMVKALAEAKEAGIDPAPVLNLVDWNE